MKRLMLLLLALSMLLTACSIRVEMPAKSTDAGVSSSEGYSEESQEEDPDFYDLADVDETTRYEKAVEIRIYYTKFMGKKISLAGQHYFDGSYHFMRVVDNANCCYADFEIITRDGKYPEEDAWFKIEGVLSAYEEGGKEYPYIDVYETTPWD